MRRSRGWESRLALVLEAWPTVVRALKLCNWQGNWLHAVDTRPSGEGREGWFEPPAAVYVAQCQWPDRGHPIDDVW